MKVSFITTVLNEDSSIEDFLESLNAQTHQPDEIVIVDGGSTDVTREKILHFKFQISKFKVLQKKGNRSIGRNEAIKYATGDVIAIADAGCILQKDWLENLITPFEDPKVDSVAGYYKGKADTVLQKCVVPYVLVMPDKVNPAAFLPATRSMAIRKKVWQELEGFPEQFNHNEDYVFAKRLQKSEKKIVFAQNAVVEWIPPRRLKQIYRMFYRFALGDAEAGIWRPKVILLLARYVFGLILLALALVFRITWLWWLLVLIFVFYLLWSVWKNYRYVHNAQALFYLPLLQLLSDLAVIHGTIKGLLNLKS